jgi:hypothetical protein
VVDGTEISIAFCLNSVGLDNVILNDIDTFVDSVSLIDVTEIDIGLCLNSVGFPSVILNDIGTPVFSFGWMASTTRWWYYIAVSVMVIDTSILHLQCH